VTTRRIGILRYDVYASASCSVRDEKMLPWVTYDEPWRIYRRRVG
jgi:hypothetical protein